MASGPITSWQIDGEIMETVTDFLFLGSKITADGDCSHKIKTRPPWKKSYEKPRQNIKNQRHYFAAKGSYSQSYSFSSKEQASFNFMSAVTICSDFGARQNKVCHCFHYSPIYLPWSDGTGCHVVRTNKVNTGHHGGPLFRALWQRKRERNMWYLEGAAESSERFSSYMTAKKSAAGKNARKKEKLSSSRRLERSQYGSQC